MQDAMKRVEELKQETIEKSKQIPNSDAIVKARLEEFLKSDKTLVSNSRHIE